MKKLISGLFCFWIFTAAITVTAQVTPSIEWEKSLGGSSNDYAYSIQQTTDNGFIVAGYSASTDGDVAGNHGSYDYWITKLDLNGNLDWQKSFGGSAGENAFSVRQTTDDGFIVAGSSYSNDNDVTGNYGDSDYWITKLDSDGNLDWQKSLGGSASDRANSIQQTTDGGFISAGYVWSDDGAVTGFHGEYDSWVVKLSASGSLDWQKALGGTGGDVANSIQQTNDGGFIIAGYSDSNDGDVSGNHGSSDVWIVKLNADGNLVWEKSLGGSGDDRANYIRQIIEGGFIIAGYSYSNDGDVSGNHGDADYWIVKVDANGNLIWQKSLGGTGTDAAYSVQQTSDDGFIIAGYSNSNSDDVSGNHGSNDYWIVKLDENGDLVWEKSLGGSGDDEAFSIMQTNEGRYVISGWSYSIDNDVSGNHGMADYWIVKLSSDTATAIPTVPSYFSSFNPNPVKSQLTIKLAMPSNEVSISVYDLQGRRIELPTTFSKTETQINTTSLADGFYILQIANSKTGEGEVARFVKQ